MKIERREKDFTLIRKTYDEVFDYSTLFTINKLISEGTIDILDFPIATGKEANIFRGSVGDKFVAVKIFRVATATFKNFLKYIVGDPRFKSISHSHRELVYTWARKEYKNLVKLYDAGVIVPKPLRLYNNVLVMEYIGDETKAAPMLKDVKLRAKKKAYEKIIACIKKIYEDACMVHGDMSEYNILVNGDKFVYIDLAQAVVLKHPMAYELLFRDIRNICRYFTKLGVKCDANDIIEDVKRWKKCIT
ncbi:MAG: serine protein kinase RIO [Candidatus Thermoplasmatota archaeon]